MCSGRSKPSCSLQSNEEGVGLLNASILIEFGTASEGDTEIIVDVMQFSDRYERRAFILIWACEYLVEFTKMRVILIIVMDRDSQWEVSN